MVTPEMIAAVRQKEYRMLIGGRWVGSVTGETFTTLDPATGELLARVPSASAEDVHLAVEAAKEAFPKWQLTAPKERARLIREVIRRLRERTEEFGLIDALDSGNPVSAMRGDVGLAAEWMEYFCGLALELKGETIPASATHLHYTLREPYGVVARIIPYNHPILFAAYEIVPPLIAGNTVVLKPAEQTPLSALVLGEIVREILPAGVVNVITGFGPTAGAPLVQHPEVRRIAFTGGVETGKLIQRLAAESGVIKHVTLELGGKNPMIVFPDVDIDKAVAAVVRGMNFHWCQGQSCGSTSRLFLHRDIHDPFLERLIQRVEAIKVGLPTREETEMGCLVSQEQYSKVMRYIDYGKEDGAQLVAGGDRPEEPELSRGFFVRPTVFDRVTSDMRIAQEEIFGPVLSIIPWDNYERMITEVNSVVYGLTASIWTNDVRLAHRTVSLVQAGYVWVNTSSAHFVGMPFGGYKDSGLGREESLEQLLSYTQTKSVHVALE